VKSLKDELRAARWLDRIVWLICIYVLLLTPFYIYSSHQYGYYITRHRAENARLDKLQKIGFAFASFLLGAGLAMEFLPDTKVKTYYSDGSTSTHTEGNAMNYIIIAIKLALVAAAACVFSFVSIFIMSYVTITAFKRNHDWSKVAAATAALTSKATEVAGKAGEVAKKAATKAVEAANEKIQQQKALKDGNTQDTEM
jgi:ABC-type Fe3+ transport system permease subunit